MKKKIFYLLLVSFLFLPFVVNGAEVQAGGVKIDGANVPGLTFDSTNNILELNNYDGGTLEFVDFADGETVTINVKGDNKITPADNTLDALTTEDDLTFVINGSNNSTLEIKNAYNGILTNDGDIKINNLSLTFSGIEYCVIIANSSGNIYINNSNIVAKDSLYGIYSDDGDLDFIDSTLLFDGVNDYIISTYGGGLNMTGSNVEIKNATGSYGIYTEEEENNKYVIKDSTITIDGPEYAMWLCNRYDFINSVVSIKNATYGFYNIAGEYFDAATTFENTKFTVEDTENAIELYSSLFIKKGSKVHIKDCEYSIYIDDYHEGITTPNFLVEDSEILIDSESLDPLVDRCGIMTDAIVKIKNSTLTFTNLRFAMMNFITDLVLENSKIIIKSEKEQSTGIYEAGGKIVIDSSILDIDVDSYGVLVDNDDTSDSLIEIKGTSYVGDEKIAPRVYKTLDGDYYTVLGEELDSANIKTLDDVWDAASGKIQVLVKEENPNTLDHVLEYLGLGIVSSLGLGISIYSKKRFKGLA